MLKHVKKRIVQTRLTTCLYSVLVFIVLLSFFSYSGKYNYPHIPVEEIPKQLYIQTTLDIVKNAKIECKYEQILSSTKSLQTWEVPREYNSFKPTGVANGSYIPKDCNPAFSVAILVTYRNRQKQLDVFIPYLHNFLWKQNIHYKIYLIEQQDDKPWNKGMLYNIGAKRAIADGFPCLILHDVDLVPLDESNLYVCTDQPRHMSASLSKFRFVLPYHFLVGGALAIRSDQFLAVDGFSNRFYGWGGEDDDFFQRMESHGLTVQRFPRNMSRYLMLPHPPAARNSDRLHIMAENARRTDYKDGLSTLPYTHTEVRHHRLFLWILVRF